MAFALLVATRRGRVAKEELAVRMHLPLATLDQRLRAAGRSAGVDMLAIDD